MLSLIRGQRVKLSDLSNTTVFDVGISLTSNIKVDISCFGVDVQNKLSDDRYFIFYNQKSSPCGSLVSLGSQNGDNERFKVDFSRLPSTIRKLVFTITIDGEDNMSKIQNGYLRILDKTTELAKFSFSGQDFSNEKAVMIGEIYFKDIWRFSALGQGFNGGLNALLKHFGGDEFSPKDIQRKKVDIKKYKVDISEIVKDNVKTDVSEQIKELQEPQQIIKHEEHKEDSIANLSKEELKTKLLELKELLDDGLIEQEEYNAEKENLMTAWRASGSSEKNIQEEATKVSIIKNLPATKEQVEKLPEVKQNLTPEISNSNSTQLINKQFSNPKEIWEYYSYLLPNFKFDGTYYLGNEIPEKKLINAMRSFLKDLEEDEILILYYDSTVLGKGDDGGAITNKRIIVKEFSRDAVSIPFTNDFEIKYQYTIKNSITKKEVVIRDTNLQESLDKKNVIYQINTKYPTNSLIPISFSSNSYPIAYFLQSIKKNHFEDQLLNIKNCLSDFYTGHRERTLRDCPEYIKEAYLKMLTPVINADGVVDPSESEELYKQFLELNCNAQTRRNVMEALASEGSIENNVELYIKEFKRVMEYVPFSERNKIILSLYKDIIQIAKIDIMQMDEVELSIARDFKKSLAMDDKQSSDIEQYVENSIKLMRGEISEKEFIKATKGLISVVGGIGVPITALYFSGTVGFAGPAITTGLASLGKIVLMSATIPGVNAMTAGIGVLVVAGVGAYKGVSYLSGATERENKKKREVMINLILENHQKIIVMLQKDMGVISEELRIAMINTEKNSLIINKLNKQMSLFQQTLMSSKKTEASMEQERRRAASA